MVLSTQKELEYPVGKIYMKSRGGESFSRMSLYEGKHACLPRSQSCPSRPPTAPHLEAVRPRLAGVFDRPKDKRQSSMPRSKELNEWDWVSRFKDSQNFLIPGNNKTSYKIQWGYQGPEYAEKCRVRDKMLTMTHGETKPQWYPKDILQVSLLRTEKNKTDPYYLDNPIPHKIVNTFGCHEAPPREVPHSYERWNSEDAWKDSKNHAVFKITGK